MPSVPAIPPGFHTINCYLIVPSSKDALDFYAKAFGAEKGLVMEMPGGGIMHAEMTLGDSKFMLTDSNKQWQKQSPADLGGSPVAMHIYVEDTDAMFEQAVAAGCKPSFPPADMFWGDRFCQVIDVYGHTWSIATYQEEVPEDEMQTRAAAFFAQMGDGGEC